MRGRLGRPTIFKPEYSEALIAFFDVPPNKKELVAKSEAFDKKTGEVTFTKNEYKKVPNTLPTLYRFAKKINVSFQTLHGWLNKGYKLREQENDGVQLSEENKEFVKFTYAYETAKELYKQFLIINGLENLYNGAFAIFVAKNTTDMKDTSEANVKVIQIDLANLLTEAKRLRNEITNENQLNSYSGTGNGVYQKPNQIYSGDMGTLPTASKG